MSLRVGLAARQILFPKVGGWAYLNWALGLRTVGCEVIWLEAVDPKMPAEKVQMLAAVLKSRLERYELAGSVDLCSWWSEPLSSAATEGCVDLEAACTADLLLNLAYGIPPGVVGR